ncbi:DegT/DnrJ/EryC1/StrS family aminotransferase [Bradyrhizobium sp. HKCCYLS20291]|uniref:DegT/DnrJ/EryC1/StrS family aminotransferase n=1 Tax=Bradyrhizobium sp. HKCCYLS20291 TaxID=3420766 RepID=UPI003EB8DE5A
MAFNHLAIEGGRPVRTAHWPRFDKGDVDLDERETEAVNRVLRSRLLFRYDARPLADTEVGRFEAELCAYFGVKYALAVSSGTAAIALSLMALGVKAGDEVICSSFAFAADPSSIILSGARPVLADVDRHIHMDPADLEARITSRTKAVLLVHQRGQAGDIEAILDVARRHSLPVVEDAVPAMGAKMGVRHLGTFGHFGAFSTQADKSLNTGEGGFLLTNHADLFEKAVLLSGAYETRSRKHCSWEMMAREQEFPLFNFRMDEIRGAIARVQLEKLPHRLATLQRNYRRLCTFLASYPEVLPRRSCAAEATLGHYIVFQLSDSDSEDAQWVADALSAEGVDAGCFGILGRPNIRSFWNWEFLYPGKTWSEIRAMLSATSRMLDLTIDVPLSPALKLADLNDLESAFAKVLDARRERRAVRLPARNLA